MYRLGIEAILGISREGNALKINPCIPKDWPGFKVDYRFGTAYYKISVENPEGVNRGTSQSGSTGWESRVQQPTLQEQWDNNTVSG